MLLLTYHTIDPVALYLGPLDIRWYGIAYVFAILLGWKYCISRIKLKPGGVTRQDLFDLVPWVALGITIGGRLGFVFFYQPLNFLTRPWEIFFTWQGGMSFHGGLIGMAFAVYWFGRRYRQSFLEVGDLMALAAPIGLLFGRIANFINGEHFGRRTEVSWAMVFPYGGPWPRHPSQLYEAGLEGLFLFILLWAIDRFMSVRQNHPGFLIAVFLVGYGMIRIFGEFYREPDGYIWFLTFGQLYSVPMIIIGLYLIWYVYNHKTPHNCRF
jgi:phosphatidylglycerol:prolipoprotein diacylglycerol transferase